MTVFSALYAVHVLAALVWVGGMFFAWMILRPAAVAKLQAPERLRFLIEREEIGILGRANRRPAECADSVCKAGMVGAWIIIDIQLYVFPASRHGERGCPRKTSLIWFVCWTVGWWEVF